MVTYRSSSFPRSSVTSALATLALIACSAPDDGGDGTAPVSEFQGLQPGNAPATAGTTGAGTAGTSGAATGGGEQMQGSLPIANGAGGSSGVAPSGSPSTPVAPAGAAGSAMVGAGGSAAVGAGGGTMVGASGGGGTGGGSMTGAGGSQPVEPEPPAPVADPFPAPAGAACGPAAFFCEGFEDFAEGAAQQNDAWRPEGAASIDGQAAEGARALRLQPGNGQFARIALNNFSAPNNSLFGRMFLRVEALPSAPNFAHWVVVEATGSGSSERVRPLGGQFIDIQDRGIRTNFWGAGADGGPTGDWTHWDNGAPVEARAAAYQCIEWRMNGADSAIDVWIDEAFQPSLSVSRDNNPRNITFVFPTFNNMTIGWGVFQGGTTPATFDVHIDDIVLSTQRAGCN